MATVPETFDTPRTPQISQAMTVGRAALMLALMVALSRITGFGRMMVTSNLYGVSPVTDAYNAAFNIPDTLSILIAGGALATGFVPVFTEMLSKGETEAAVRTFRAMWTLLGAAFGVITLTLFALTFTKFGTLLAPQKVGPETLDLYLRLLRILLVAQFFFVLGGLFSGTLNALRQFWYFAVQPVAFNLGIIICGVLFPRLFGMGIESQAWGALVGALIGSIAIQIPAVLRNGLSLQPLWDLNDPGVRKVLASLLPIVFGLASGQIIALNLPRFFAVGLMPGDVTALDNANRLMQVPLAVLASGPAIALFPTLSLLNTQNNRDEMRMQLAQAIRRTLVLCYLATALLLALREPVINVLLQHGEFTAQDTQFTATVLGCYAFALLGLSVQQFLARGFYAMQDNSTPIGIGLGSMVVFLVLAAFFTWVKPGGAASLALSAAFAITLLSAWMWGKLIDRFGGWDQGATVQVLWKGAVAGVAAFVAAFGVQAALAGYGKLGAVLALVGGTVVGAFLFVFVASLLELAEIDAVTAKLGRFRRSKRSS
jgi:putative peptidoglycan lipid II flippase